MLYDESLEWWYRRVDFERRPLGPTELKLDRMKSLLAQLGNPQDRLAIVHVAGSKGKGSTSAMIEAIARAAGLRTGMFTSPHLQVVNERIQFNGLPIDRGQLAECLTHIRPFADAMADPPTFFEIATAAAFLCFDLANVDLAVVEVGLGGRLDSTNVCRPRLSVITSISFDHTAILGDRLPQIAFEKCGIIKPGIPVVSGVVEREAAEVVRRVCDEQAAPLLELDRHFRCEHVPGRVAGSGAVTQAKMTVSALPALASMVDSDVHCYVAAKFTPPEEFALNLLGAHQAANASLAVVACHVLNTVGFNIAEPAMAHGLKSVYWPARLEVFAGPPLTVLDCAHNVASAQRLAETMATSFPAGRRILVFGCANDKDTNGILAALLPTFDGAVFCRFGNNPRAIALEQLKEIARQVGRADSILTSESPIDAYRLACLQKPTIVVITGSVYLAGELRPTLLQTS